MLVLSLLAAPTLMLAAMRAEHRFGASAGGWVAALPMSFTVAVPAVMLDRGAGAAELLAASASAHVAAQVTFALGFAAGLRRGGPSRGLTCGVAAYAACSLLVAFAPLAAAAAVAVPALLVAPLLVPAQPAPAPAAAARATTALLCLGSATLVAVAVLGSRYAGPQVGGALAAFPLTSSLLVLVVAARGGAAAGVGVLAGLVRSLPCYLGFCVLAAITMPLVGVAAVPLALAACLAIGRITWRALPVVAPIGGAA